MASMAGRFVSALDVRPGESRWLSKVGAMGEVGQRSQSLGLRLRVRKIWGRCADPRSPLVCRPTDGLARQRLAPCGRAAALCPRQQYGSL